MLPGIMGLPGNVDIPELSPAALVMAESSSATLVTPLYHSTVVMTNFVSLVTQDKEVVLSASATALTGFVAIAGIWGLVN